MAQRRINSLKSVWRRLNINLFLATSDESLRLFLFILLFTPSVLGCVLPICFPLPNELYCLLKNAHALNSCTGVCYKQNAQLDDITSLILNLKYDASRAAC